MTYLLDTNVISETRRKTPNESVLAWFNQVDPKNLYLSVLSLGELTKGVVRLRQKDPTAATSIQHWLRGIEQLFSDRLIPVDASIALAWGELNVSRPLPVIDSLLAATAITHELTLVSRNIRDIETTGVTFVNPWDQTSTDP